jgi:hypothetical protein
MNQHTKESRTIIENKLFSKLTCKPFIIYRYSSQIKALPA